MTAESVLLYQAPFVSFVLNQEERYSFEHFFVFVFILQQTNSEKANYSYFFFSLSLSQYCHVGRLSHEVGWKYQTVVRALETKRKVRAVLSIRKRDKLKKITKQAGEKVAKQIAPFSTVINNYGYN